MSHPASYLLITEVSTNDQHQIPLKRLQAGPVTLGRAGHIQIGRSSEAGPWVSRCQCTLWAEPRKENPDLWDYFVHDGCIHENEWQLSKEGLWVAGERVVGKLNLRPGPGEIVLFPKIFDFRYFCILEWELVKDPTDDTENDPPTRQAYDEAKRRERIFKAEAAQLQEQLSELAKRMVILKEQSTAEIGQLVKVIEEKREIDAQQQKSIAALESRSRKIRVAVLVLSIFMVIMAALALNISQETIKDMIEWTMLIGALVGGAFGIKSL